MAQKFPKLFIPGPIDVSKDVFDAMSVQQIGHRTKTVTELQKRISDNAQKLMYTKNTIILTTTSGSGIMEMCIRSLVNKKVAVFSVGAFGDRWYKMAVDNGKEATHFKAADGEPTTPEDVEKALKTGEYDVVTVTHNETSSGIMNPTEEIGKIVAKYPGVIYCVDTVSSLGGAKVEVDKSNIDVCLTSTQKCIGLPPGLAIASVSDKAIKRAEEVKNKGFYLNLTTVVKKAQSNYQYPSTPATSLMWGLDYQLDKIVNKEGLDNRFDRHEKLADIVRDWGAKHFELFAKEGYRSNTVTVIKNTKGHSIADLNKELEKVGFVIANGYGDYKEKTFRIATMGDRTEKELKELLAAIEKIWNLK